MTLTQRELEWHADRHQGYFGRNPKDTINELKSNRFAIGFVSGVYPGGKEESHLSVGPNGEKAWADQFAVFYKKGTYTIHQTPDFWPNNIPQGLSCGVGAVGATTHGFVPVDCNKLVLKVAKKPICDCNEDGESIGDADCFDGAVLYWQFGYRCNPKWINYPSEDLPNSTTSNIPKLTTPNPTEYGDNGGLILNWNDDDDPWGNDDDPWCGNDDDPWGDE